MIVTPIRALKDNYIWMLSDDGMREAWVVDPGEAAPVIAILKEKNIILSGILLTHHHADHSAGIAELMQYSANTPVFGSYKSPLRTVTHPVREGDRFLCLTHSFQVIDIPGHTLDHVAFYADNILFCGDTLFSGGCGKVFEGTYPQMYTSLCKLAQLNEETQIYCGHEYTYANLTFGSTVEPFNKQISDKMNVVSRVDCTLPTRLLEEKQINPFLRCHMPDVVVAAERYAERKLNMPEDVFKVIREWKNNF